MIRRNVEITKAENGWVLEAFEDDALVMVTVHEYWEALIRELTRFLNVDGSD
jgi:hypothetical protein